jgi:hypothetical protein
MSGTETTVKPAVATAAKSEALEFATGTERCQEMGICKSCVHRSTCLFLASARRPIYFCEEFDDRNGDELVKAPAVDSPPREEINYGEAQEQGLCANCVSKADCMNRRPGVAVWHCEDYS